LRGVPRRAHRWRASLCQGRRAHRPRVARVTAEFVVLGGEPDRA
jgi:hypothetical protein